MADRKMRAEKVKTQECSAQKLIGWKMTTKITKKNTKVTKLIESKDSDPKTFLWFLCSSLCFCGQPGFISTESTSMPNTFGDDAIFNFSARIFPPVVWLKSNLDRPSLKCDCACRFLPCKSDFQIAFERRQQ